MESQIGGHANNAKGMKTFQLLCELETFGIFLQVNIRMS